MRKILAASLAVLLIGLDPALAQDNLDQISQGGLTASDSPTLPLSGEVAIEQIGMDNVADVTSDSDVSTLLIEQRGDEQSAFVRLSGAGNQGELTQQGVGNSADIVISGTVNVFSISQSSTSGNSDVDANQAILEQLGLGNTAFQTQIGRANQMTLRQEGSDNFADLLQDGQSNVMELAQNGDNNAATLKQFGIEAAPIIVTQNGGMSVEITQTGE